MMLGLIPKLNRASHAIAVYIAASPELALNQAEAHVLASLRSTTSSTINELHVTFGHRRSTLTSVLDRLERRGLVKRSVSELDRRSVRVTLTSAGKKFALHAHKLLSSAEARIRKKFSSAEIEAFCTVADAFSELKP